MPRSADYRLKSQLIRAATSVALNIAEGSTGQTNAEQARFLGFAVRSLLETVACQQVSNRLRFLQDKGPLRQAYHRAETLAAKVQAVRTAIAPERPWVREEARENHTESGVDDGRR